MKILSIKNSNRLTFHNFFNRFTLFPFLKKCKEKIFLCNNILVYYLTIIHVSLFLSFFSSSTIFHNFVIRIQTYLYLCTKNLWSNCKYSVIVNIIIEPSIAKLQNFEGRIWFRYRSLCLCRGKEQWYKWI